jgi:hypothetical protein
MGRSRAGRSRRTRIDGQFAAREIKMLESPVFSVLSLSARRALDRRASHTGHVRSFAAGYCYDHAGQGRDEQQRAYPEAQKALATRVSEPWYVGQAQAFVPPYSQAGPVCPGNARGIDCRVWPPPIEDDPDRKRAGGGG